MADRYWVSGSGNWDSSTTTHWGSASGVADGASVPTSSDNVIFDSLSNASAYTVTITATANCADLTMGAPLSGAVTWAGSSALNVYGLFNLSGGASITNSYTGTITFKATSGTKNITWNGITITSPIVFNGVGGTWQFQGALTQSGSGNDITHTNGTLDTNGKTIVTYSFSSNNTNTRVLTLGASSITSNGNGANQVIMDSSNLTFNANTSAFIVGAFNVSLGLGGLAYYNFTANVGSGSFTWLNGATSFNVLTLNLAAGSIGNVPGSTCVTLTINGASNKTGTVAFSSAVTVTGTFTVTGNSDINRVYIKSSVTATARTISAAVNAITRADFQDITAAGAANWNLSAVTGNSGDAGGNTGITFTTAADQHWLNASSSSWSTSSNWTSRVPLPQDDVFMDKAFGTSQTVTGDMPRAGKTINWSGATWTTGLTWNKSVVTAYYGALITLDTLTVSGSAFTVGGRNSFLSTANITVSDTSNTALTFAGGGFTYNNLYFSRSTSTGSITITGSNTFADFKDDGTGAHSILFTAGITTTVTTFTVSGTVGALITINSTSTATHALVKSGGGTIVRDYLNIQHSVATPINTWYPGANSVNNQAVATIGSGWMFDQFLPGMLSRGIRTNQAPKQASSW